MALSSLSSVRLAGVAAAVPHQKVSNNDYPYLTETEKTNLIKATGIEFRRVSPKEQCTSDLCQAAAERLLENLEWEKKEVDALVFVSQTPDYPLPATSILLQDRLGLSKSCLAFDINLGCSGYVYGIAALGGLVSSMKLSRVLLLVGDTPSKNVSPRDRSAAPLFGDAGTATALEFCETASPLHVNLCSDGGRWSAIRIPAGGYREPVTAKNLEMEPCGEGIYRDQSHLVMEGVEVFNFSLREVPSSVKATLSAAGLSVEDVDFFLFHQANQLMNEAIRKKLKIAASQTPGSLADFGNTSSASIPLTMVTRLRDALAERKLRMLMCGFGVGLSWGSLLIETEKVVCPELVEL